MYYSIFVNGNQKLREENAKWRTFKDVKVFAGDNFYPPTDATYSSFSWTQLKGMLCTRYYYDS